MGGLCNLSIKILFVHFENLFLDSTFCACCLHSLLNLFKDPWHSDKPVDVGFKMAKMKCIMNLTSILLNGNLLGLKCFMFSRRVPLSAFLSAKQHVPPFKWERAIESNCSKTLCKAGKSRKDHKASETSATSEAS